MSKEVIFAIIAGGIIGLLGAFVIWKIASRFNSPIPKTQVAAIDIPSPTPSGEALTTNFRDGLIVNQNIQNLSGVTTPDSTVVISTAEEDYFTFSDGTGHFEKEIELTSSVNNLSIKSYQGSNRSELDLTLIYSTEFEVTEPAQEVAYLGSVTDLSETNIQIKSDSGEISLATYDNLEIEVIRLGTTDKKVTPEDIAIGDSIVAMGQKNGNQVLNAQRILITSIIEDPKLTVTLGRGDEITTDKSTQILQFKEGEITKAKAVDIEDETEIISVTEEKKNPRSVLILVKKLTE